MSQVPTPTTNPAPGADPTPDPTPEPAPVEPQQTEPKVYDEKHVKALRAENAEWRTKLREEQKAREALENEKLSETEQVKKEAESAQTRAQALEVRVKRAEVLQAASGKEIANPALAADLIDPSKVELDDDGNATNADDLLDALIEKYPDLKAKPKASDEERKSDLKQILKDGDLVKDGKQVYEGQQARDLLERDPDAFHKAMDEGRIKNV